MWLYVTSDTRFYFFLALYYNKLCNMTSIRFLVILKSTLTLFHLISKYIVIILFIFFYNYFGWFPPTSSHFYLKYWTFNLLYTLIFKIVLSLLNYLDSYPFFRYYSIIIIWFFRHFWQVYFIDQLIIS